MLQRFTCWLRGHVIKAQFIIMPPANSYRLIYYCERCNKPLPGPEL